MLSRNGETKDNWNWWNNVRGVPYAPPAIVLPKDNVLTTVSFNWHDMFLLTVTGTSEQIMAFVADNNELAASNEEFFYHTERGHLYAGRSSKKRFFLREFYWSCKIAPDDASKLILTDRHYNIASAWIGALPHTPVPESMIVNP